MEFRFRLREIRKGKGLTQVEVANSVNIKERQYQNLESGVYRPSFDTIVALADFFEVSVDYLIGRIDEPHGLFKPKD